MRGRRIIGERNSFTDSTLESSFRDYGVPNARLNGHFRDRNSYREDKDGNIILSEEEDYYNRTYDEQGRRLSDNEDDYDD